MTIETNYSPARAELAQRLSRITDEREIAVLKRRKHPSVAMISAEELAGLMETAQLLRAPANAQRLLAALGRARLDTPPQATDVASLRKEPGLRGSGAVAHRRVRSRFHRRPETLGRHRPRHGQTTSRSGRGGFARSL